MIETGLRHQIEAQLAHPWAFRLPGSLDALYEAKLGADRRCGLCLTLLVAAAAVGAVGILNWVNEPAMFAQSWLPRLAVTFLLILGAASMRSARRGWPEGLSFGVPIVATTMLIVWIGGEGPVSFADRSSIVALLVLACVCAVSPLPLLTAGLVAIGGFAGLAWMRHHVLWKLHGGGNATLLVFGAVALSVALLMARHREVARRRGFLCAARDALNAEELMRMNAELQLLMDTDVLTGVCNRRRFEADLNARWPYRDTSGLALLLIDVDHFKRFNDEQATPRAINACATSPAPSPAWCGAGLSPWLVGAARSLWCSRLVSCRRRLQACANGFAPPCWLWICPTLPLPPAGSPYPWAVRGAALARRATRRTICCAGPMERCMRPRQAAATVSCWAAPATWSLCAAQQGSPDQASDTTFL